MGKQIYKKYLYSVRRLRGTPMFNNHTLTIKLYSVRENNLELVNVPFLFVLWQFFFRPGAIGKHSVLVYNVTHLFQDANLISDFILTAVAVCSIVSFT